MLFVRNISAPSSSFYNFVPVGIPSHERIPSLWRVLFCSSGGQGKHQVHEAISFSSQWGRVWHQTFGTIQSFSCASHFPGYLAQIHLPCCAKDKKEAST